MKTLSSLAAAEEFNELISYFTRAIHSGAIDLVHSSVIITRYDCFSAHFDAFVKLLCDDLRDEAIYGGNGALVCRIMAESFEGVGLLLFFLL